MIRLILILLLIPSVAFGYTETFYLCTSGNGSAPETDSCTGAFDEADIATNTNWANVDSNDGKIGPNDIVYLKDDQGSFGTITISGLSNYTGISGKPVTFMTYTGDTVATGAITVAEKYITFDGGDPWYESQTTTMTMTIADSSGGGFKINTAGDVADYATIRDMKITSSGTTANTKYGIWIRSDNYLIHGVEISNMSVGIKVNYDTSVETGVIYGTMEKNKIYNNISGDAGMADCINVDSWPGGGLYNDFSGTDITNNWVYDCEDDGIDVFGAKNITIDGNQVGPSTISSAGDCNGIKGGGRDNGTGWNVIKNNFITGLNSMTCSANDINGIDTNPDSQEDIIHHNIIVNSGNGSSGKGIKAFQNDLIIFQNSVLMSAGTDAIYIEGVQVGDQAYLQNNVVSKNSGYDLNTCGGGGVYDNTGTGTIAGGYNLMANDSDPCDTTVYSGESNDIDATDPEWNTSTLKPNAGSPIEGAGTDLSGFDTGQYDYCIDQDSTWAPTFNIIENTNTSDDIGAFCAATAAGSRNRLHIISQR